MSKSRTRAVNLLLLVASLLSCLVLAEILLRFFEPVEFRLRGNAIILHGNTSTTIRNDTFGKLDATIVKTTNAIGFRGDDLPVAFDAFLTIVTVGGSTTECFYLSDGSTWPEVLGKRLQQSFSNLWINNAGFDGHSTFGHALLLQQYLSQLKPDVIVYMVGLNDTEIDARSVEAGNAYDHALDAAASQERPISFSDGLTALWRGELTVYAARYSHLVNFFLSVARSRKADSGSLGHSELDVARLPVATEDTVAREAFFREHRERFLPLYRARLEQLIDRTREHGIMPVLVTQTALWTDGVDAATGLLLGDRQAGRFSAASMWKHLESYNDVTRSVGKERGVPVIDLAAEFPHSSVYFYDSYHFTAQGAAAVAEILNRELCPVLAAAFPEHVKGACPQ